MQYRSISYEDIEVVQYAPRGKWYLFHTVGVLVGTIEDILEAVDVVVAGDSEYIPLEEYELINAAEAYANANF